MEKIVSIILIVGVLVLAGWSLFRNYTKPLVPPRKEEDEELRGGDDPETETIVDYYDETDKNMEQMDIQIPDSSTTRTSLMVALRKLNLQYEFDEGQNLIATYQGERFRIIADNESIWIQIQDCWWYRESLDDIDNLALLHRAVNECNIRDANKMVYTYNKEEHEVGIHTLRDLLWLPQIPDSDQYLQAAFDTMLRSHHYFFRMMEELRKEEYGRHI